MDYQEATVKARILVQEMQKRGAVRETVVYGWGNNMPAKDDTACCVVVLTTRTKTVFTGTGLSFLHPNDVNILPDNDDARLTGYELACARAEIALGLQLFAQLDPQFVPFVNAGIESAVYHSKMGKEKHHENGSVGHRDCQANS